MAASPVAPTGAGDRGGRLLRDWSLGLWSVLAILFLFLPIVIAIIFSFNDPAGRFNFTWQGFTLDHWLNPFSDPDLAKSMTTSIELAVVSTIASTGLGTLLAIALVRHRFRGRGTADFFVFLPMATPEVVLGRQPARAVPRGGPEHRVPHALHRAHDVQPLLRGGDGEGAAGGHGSAHRGGRA